MWYLVGACMVLIRGVLVFNIFFLYLSIAPLFEEWNFLKKAHVGLKSFIYA